MLICLILYCIAFSPTYPNFESQMPHQSLVDLKREIDVAGSVDSSSIRNVLKILKQTPLQYIHIEACEWFIAANMAPV